VFGIRLTSRGVMSGKESIVDCVHVERVYAVQKQLDWISVMAGRSGER
jgi:hypothetical protein